LHAAALATNGTIWSWGYNGEGQVGNNTTGNQVWPAQEWTQATDWISVSAGSNHTVALKRDVNVVIHEYDASVGDYARLGVRRCSVGGSLASRTWKAFDEVARSLRACEP